MDRTTAPRLFTWLVVYYGVWQTAHWIGNLTAFSVSDQPARLLLGGTMNDVQFDALLGSAVIDVTVASSSGILFAVAWMMGKGWAAPVGLVSLTIAMYSAYLYVYLHATYGTFVWDPLNFLLLWGLFVPPMVLYVWLIVRSVQTSRA